MNGDFPGLSNLVPGDIGSCQYRTLRSAFAGVSFATGACEFESPRRDTPNPIATPNAKVAIATTIIFFSEVMAVTPRRLDSAGMPMRCRGREVTQRSHAEVLFPPCAHRAVT